MSREHRASSRKASSISTDGGGGSGHLTAHWRSLGRSLDPSGEARRAEEPVGPRRASCSEKQMTPRCFPGRQTRASVPMAARAEDAISLRTPLNACGRLAGAHCARHSGDQAREPRTRTCRPAPLSGCKDPQEGWPQEPSRPSQSRTERPCRQLPSARATTQMAISSQTRLHGHRKSGHPRESSQHLHPSTVRRRPKASQNYAAGRARDQSPSSLCRELEFVEVYGRWTRR